MFGFFVLDNFALLIYTSLLFKVEYAVVTSVYERVIVKHTTDPAPAQSDVCSETSNLGIQRNHVALQSGNGQVQSLDKNMQKNFNVNFLCIFCSVNHIMN